MEEYLEARIYLNNSGMGHLYQMWEPGWSIKRVIDYATYLRAAE